jgi:hypothetical protein
VTGLATRIAVPAAVQSVPWKLIFDGILALAFLAVLAWGLRVNDLRGRWQHQWQSEHLGRLADRATYEAAQQRAAAENKANVAAKEAESKRITDETQSAYQRDHAELVRLREQRTAAAKGSTGAARASETSATAAGADDHGLQLSPDEYLQAQEIELRLMHLQNWVERQLAVDPNKGANP